ncbi:MAG: aminotransferase class I/II-fold pyridoxal phosphate-dependent enzyme [Sphaerochaetaceae bacterium]
MQAIILAAGMGKRLKELTKENTKCMVKVNETTLIERSLRQLDALGLSNIILVIGYKGDNLVSFVNTLNIKTPITFVNNPIYDTTNNIYSLYLAKDYLLAEDTLLLESDLIIEDGILEKFVSFHSQNAVLVAKWEPWMDGTVVTIDHNQRIQAFLDKKQFKYNNTHEYYKTVNIYRFSKDFSASHYVPFLEAYCTALGHNEYYEQVLKVIAQLSDPWIHAMVLEDEKWYEIDDIQDLDIAETLFETDPVARFERINARYGGFWRFGSIVDFCYLVNPYFPPPKLVDELKSHFDVLLRQYPSGQSVNNLLAANYYGLRPSSTYVGNGAAELIKALIESEKGKIGLMAPSFDEYRNRAQEEQLEVFIPSQNDFSYHANDIISFYSNKNLSMLLLVNPENPTGFSLTLEEITKIIDWTKTQNITLVIDESFSDFSYLESLFNQDLLDENPHLVVIKSISKSFGVPGLRLGILATQSTPILKRMSQELSIWNINSFGEYFMQVWGKYRASYQDSLTFIKEARALFEQELHTVPSLTVYPSQANYVLCEVGKNYNSYNLAVQLLEHDGLLIKDLSQKRGIAPRQCIRLAVRTKEENTRLAQALKKYLK